MIIITKVDKVAFIKKVYELSKPQGMGILHYKPGPLPDDMAKSLVHPDGTFYLDYVLGRSCKMFATKIHDDIVIRDDWYDHSEEEFEGLKKEFGL